ncbi:MAG: TIGR03960 family B12-binding radical SAM protein [Propionibacteriaceae bacterium]|nr:TIGR03960 family B12-binding radical SAM protein [Propionibacteriaceae bacterium]
MKSRSEAPESLFARLEPLLAVVARPAQYVGGEPNAVVKDWSAAAVRWCLLYPDAYAVGQSSQGLAVLYELLNAQPDCLAERSFSVWPDLADLMRQNSLTQFTLESHRPVRAFDVIGVSLATELGYTNLLEALDLAGLPLRAADRTKLDPFVVVGGHGAANPEPIADYIDLAVLGDGEEAVLDLSRAFAAWDAAGRPAGRTGLLQRLAQTGQFYVPAFHTVSYAADGRIAAVTPNRPGVPARVRKYTLTDLDAWPYPVRPLAPIAETVHERYSVEIFRGCTRGCRFCQAGMISRPVRERSLDAIAQMIDQGLAATGLEEVGLLSLSSADHSEIGPLAHGLADRYEGTNVSLSLPSTRVDAFNIALAGELARNGRRSGLTFAPEGGSERLRRVINKNVDEADLMATVETAFQAGWRQIKLYFMCGLPTETDDDILAIADQAFRVIAAGRRVSGQRDIGCTLSVGGFVPKAHTPFQWAAQADAETVDRRLKLLRQAVRADRRYGRAVTVRYQDGRPGLVEGLLARGDRRVGRVIEAVWRAGGRFDGWSEHFSYDRWADCAAAELAPWGLSLDWYTTRQRDGDEVLPWDHLDFGLDRDWLWDDWQDALAETPVPDCRWEGCSDCGVCPALGVDLELGPTGRPLPPPRPAPRLPRPTCPGAVALAGKTAERA